MAEHPVQFALLVWVPVGGETRLIESRGSVSSALLAQGVSVQKALGAKIDAAKQHIVTQWAEASEAHR